MLNDKLLTITVGTSRKSKSWVRQEIMWSELCEKLRTPYRSTETLNEYMKMPKSEQDNLKDLGGFVGGTIEGSQRRASSVSGRDIITLDMDSIPAGATQDVLRRVDALGCSYCIYSTRKHSEAAPRLRILVPINRTCSADEYEPGARKLAEFIGMEMCDPTTFEASRLMYWPSCSADSNYVYTYSDKPFIDIDGLLRLYDNWHDVSSWQGVSTPKLPTGAKQADPTEKSGIVGAFCKVYDVYRVIYDVIPGVYAPCDSEDRFTYVGGSTTGGAVVYGDGKFLYSHHATDPAGGKLCNAFDLVRLHMFGDKDDDAKPDTPTNKLPSFVEMCRFAVADKSVSALMNKERYDEAVAGFTDTPVEDTENWISLLELSTVTGSPTKTIDNAFIILENDPLLKGKVLYDEFSNRVLCLGALPWDPRTEHRVWTDNDDSGLRHYMERTYRITGKDRIYDAFSMSCRKHQFNAVKDYLLSLPPWDGVKRLDTLFIDYLGAEDNIYTRAVCRKSIVAAVARALDPGCKYDTMPILSGSQGIGKSTFLRILGGSWFSDSLTTFEGKDACEMLQGVWINELGELNGLSRSETNAVKQFLSKVEDIFREPYGRRTGTYPRRCVFFGTTNDSEFLKDKTGNRRFWPVDCGIEPASKNVFHDLAIELPQIWAEALAMWQLGEPLYLTGEALRLSQVSQAEHSECDIKDGMVLEFISRKVPADWAKRTLAQRKMYWATDFRKDEADCVERDKICAAEIWCECLGGDVKYMRRADTVAINAVIAQSDEWVKVNKAMRFGGEYGVQKGFIRQKIQ